MSPDSEEIQHESVDREKPLRVRSGFEPAHLSLALSRRLMRNLCAVVLVSVRAMGDGRHDRSVRSPVAAQLVGDQSHGLTLLALQQLAKKVFGSPAVASRLDENIEDVTILIDGTPEIAPLSLDGDEDLVQVPDVAQPALSTREPAATGMNASIERALEQLRTTTRDDLLTARKVGRAGLPTTTLGLLFHAAEHSTRHAGQAISTAKILAGS